MPRRSVMVIGSGPIVIGQAAEFDYAGVQACRALREEGHRVVLVNSNPATIMTDPEIADAVYLEPLTVASVEAIIARERPDALLPTLGGQTGLNLAVELDEAGVLSSTASKCSARQSTRSSSPKTASASSKMQEIGEPVPAERHRHRDRAGRRVREPIRLSARRATRVHARRHRRRRRLQRARAARNAGRRPDASMIQQALVETSLLGWKEIEYEILRDKRDNCIIVCNMENIDAVGVHTGDSIVVAPHRRCPTTNSRCCAARASTSSARSTSRADATSSSRCIPSAASTRSSRSTRASPAALRWRPKRPDIPIAKISTQIALGKTLD